MSTDKRKRTVTAEEQELMEALRAAWDLLNDSRTRYHICDGGRGNRGDTHLYQAAKKLAVAAIDRAEYGPRETLKA